MARSKRLSVTLTLTSFGGAEWPRREKYEVLPCHVAGYEGEIIVVALTTFDRKLQWSSEGSEKKIYEGYIWPDPSGFPLP